MASTIASSASSTAWSQVIISTLRNVSSLRHATVRNHQGSITNSKQIESTIPRNRGLPHQNSKARRPSSALQRFRTTYIGSLTPLMGVGLLGSIRFGLYENFKKELAKIKGTDGQPAVLTLQDKTMAAFAAGILSSLGVVKIDLFSALLNTPESEYKSKEDRQTKYIVDLSTQQSRYSKTTVSAV